VQFVNTSRDTGKANFYWDFYNLGMYADTNINSPTWVYTSPGTYIAKLYEVNGNCGAYAYDTITVFPLINASFNPIADYCAGTTVTFTNISAGATSYYWNYGDTASNRDDTSTILVNGSHIYKTPGTYMVTLVAKNGGTCPDTSTQTITILGIPKPLIVGSYSVCSGGSDTLSATGGDSYLWSPGGQTSSVITVSTGGSVTYTVTATNMCGSHDTSITVNLANTPVAVLTANKDSICAGDTVVLTAGGGGCYLWCNSSTSGNIKVTPLKSTTYTVYVRTLHTTCIDSAEINIYVTPVITSTITISTDSICAGVSTSLNIMSNGGTPSYIWNTGETTATINVTPLATTTYYVLVTGKCTHDSIPSIITVISAPTLSIASPDTVCKGISTVLTASGAEKYIWSNGSTSAQCTLSIYGDTTIILIGKTGNCGDSIKKNIKIYSALTGKGYSDSVCSGRTTPIGIYAGGGNHAYSYSWNNGISMDSAGPFVVSTPPNQYICTITDGCGYILTDTLNISVRPSPVSSFSPSPDTISGGGFVNFVNFTSGANKYYWNLGDNNMASDTAPFHEYNIAGIYTVTLISVNSYGCSDTLTKDVYVTEQLMVPNVFTPNGDGINDVFQINAGSMQAFDIQIFNRWGQKIFESPSPNINWTGRSSSGVMEEAGTYYYIIQATDYSGKNFSLNGYVQLIR
jgi:gliding motility-associated-like protein